MTPIPHNRPWRSRSVLGIGEAMLEFASLGGDSYRRGFAGDTLNTCWHMAQLLGSQATVGYYTKVGVDAFSSELLAFVESAGMNACQIARDAERTLGLYVISLTGSERHFSYWRESSAARRLADDPVTLAAAMGECGLIHISGITLAVVGDTGQRNLLEALREARRAGAVVSFDPNVRMRLWRDASEVRYAMEAMLEVVDIALPSFDDEAALWGDVDPAATLDRLSGAGVTEIVVKDGSREVAYCSNGQRGASATPRVAEVRDTTGAGDAFNAGYLSARLVGMDVSDACRVGQQVAGIVIGNFGALAPKAALSDVSRAVQAHAPQP